MAHRHMPSLSAWLHLSGFPCWLKLVLAGCHFHCDVVCYVHNHIFDDTSLILRKGIRHYARQGDRVLDLGTGHVGLLAVYCARAHGAQVVAVDVNQEFLENARLVARASQVPDIDFVQSDWFSRVEGTFDLIVGNIPYVPSDRRQFLRHVNDYPEVWDGGSGGTTQVRKVLTDVHRFLRPSGLFLMGLNVDCVPRDTILGLIDSSEHIELQTTLKSLISRSEVYVIAASNQA
ncbi:MAG: class I SAM-dependent methyltransferase [Desulfomonile tiedjei]|nr:class I SAM-dependent methyltransferase [Desulfomonile tiedjei]